MEIISWSFLLFLTVVIPVYYALNRQAQNYWLFIVSVFFLCTRGWPHLLPLAIIAVSTFLIGKKIDSRTGKSWIIAGITFNVVVFVIYRVLNSPLFHLSDQIPLFESLGIIGGYLIPLGFSFYTLQAISYLIDIYRSTIKAETNALDFFIYMMYFPRILAGPIERAGSFLPQLKQARTVDNQKVVRGFLWILTGLFRKVAIAEVLQTIIPSNFIHAVVVNIQPSPGWLSIPFYGYATTIAYADRLIGFLAYGIYLYNDFAGYTGIMRGISLFMGIELSPNFREPFLAISLSDFWSKWHISLSSWLRDYIYFPLTRHLKKRYPQPLSLLPVILPLLVTMLAAGFWHGLTIPLLLWGFTYAFLMILEQLGFQLWPGLRPKRHNRPLRFLAGLLTFSIVTLLWVPFTANSTGEVLACWKAIVTGSGWNIPPDFSYWILILISISFLLDFLQSRYQDMTIMLKWPLPARAVMLAAVFIVLFLAFTWTSPYSSNVFVYQGF